MTTISALRKTLFATRKTLDRAFKSALVVAGMLAQGSVTVLLAPAVFAPSLIVPFATDAYAQCPEEPPLQNYSGAGSVGCPCFVPGEQAGVVLTAPPSHYPLEILRVGIGWGSLFGSNPAQIEEAIHIYEGGLPNPGTPIFTLLGPQLTDGVINLFNLELFPGNIIVNSGPFTVSLEFFNQSAGNTLASSPVHDGNGCQLGKNAVFTVPGGWNDACLLGVTGDWVVFVVYRPCTPGPTGIGDIPFVATNTPVVITTASPNPFSSATQIEFFLQQPGKASITVFDVGGRRVARLADRDYTAGTHLIGWDGVGDNGSRVPTGVYFVRVEAAGSQSVRKVLLTK